MSILRWMTPKPAAALAAALIVGGLALGTSPAAQVGVVVMVAPPAPVVETVGVAPVPGYVWIGGYWNWVGGRHVWVPGAWRPGRPGYRWVPHHWVAAGGGWRLEEGHWAR
jgi:hypothetical protein